MSIAVVIPTYNSGPYLRETLDSVFSQTIAPDEVIVIDDGSTDGTLDVIASYGESIRVLHRSRQRQAANRNLGAREAASEWVAFLDHDDLWRKDKLELQMDALRRNPQAGLCYTGRRLLVEHGDKFEMGRIVETPPPAKLSDWIFRDVSFLAGTALIRRSTFLDAGGFNTEFHYAEDWDFWLRLYHRGCSFAACLEPLLIYRVHSNNTSLAALAMLKEVERIHREQIAPHQSPLLRPLIDGRFWSRHEATGAFALRKMGESSCVGMMLRSIVHWPIGGLRRYKVLAHMLYTKLSGRAFAN